MMRELGGVFGIAVTRRGLRGRRRLRLGGGVRRRVRPRDRCRGRDGRARRRRRARAAGPAYAGRRGRRRRPAGPRAGAGGLTWQLVHLELHTARSRPGPGPVRRAVRLARGAGPGRRRVVPVARARRHRRGHRGVRDAPSGVGALRQGAPDRRGHRPGASAGRVGAARAARGAQPGGAAWSRRSRVARSRSGSRSVVAADEGGTHGGDRAARRRPGGRRGRIRGAGHARIVRHCTRTATGCSGSVPDAEDALQEALLRAWRGLPRFEGRSSLQDLAVHDRDQRLPQGDRAAAGAR